MMNKDIPMITRKFIADIAENASKGVSRFNVDGIIIDVFPYVFPPVSPFSESSHNVYEQFGDLK